MNDKKNVVVETYINETDARLAQLNLESAGIDAHIRKDDCGGAFPQLQLSEGVQLVVDVDDAERAEQILNEVKTEELQNRKIATASKKPPAWRVFFIGILTGIFLSTLFYIILDKIRSLETGRFEFDVNGDGNPDEFHHYERGLLVKIEEDRDYDGTLDSWIYYESDRVTRSEADDNFDGKVDVWASYKDRNNFQIKHDTDFDGISDATLFYAKGIMQRVDWHPGGASTVVRREIFNDSIKSKEYIDLDRDGTFDLKIGYNAFEQEVSRTAYDQ